MNCIQIPEYVVDNMIKSLKRGYCICENVDYDSDETEKTVYFANGYSRATMGDMIRQLEQYKKRSN